MSVPTGSRGRGVATKKEAWSLKRPRFLVAWERRTDLLLLRLPVARRAALAFLDRGMRGGQSGDGDAEGGAADVVEADRVAELDRLRVAAVFAADAALEVRVRLAAELHAHADQLADAAEVDRLERVALEQLLLDVLGEEDARVVAAVAEGHLRQVVRAEAEELGRLRELVGRDRGARHLDHRAVEIVDLRLLLREHRVGRVDGDLLEVVELRLGAGQRDHDLGQDLHARLLRLDGRFDDRAHLHLEDLGIRHGETVAAVAEHGIGLVQLLHAVLHLLEAQPQRLRERLLVLVVVRQEFVQRRIQEADRHRQSLHRLEDADEVFALIRQQLLQRLAAAFGVAGEDHLAHVVDALGVEEHVLRARQADAFGAEVPGDVRIVRRIGVRANLQRAVLVRPLHDLRERTSQRRFLRGDLALVDFADPTVQRQPVLRAVGLTVDAELLAGRVDVQRAGAGDAGRAHAARDDGRVARHAARAREDALGDVHAADVRRLGLATDEDDLLARGYPLVRFLSGERELADGRAGRGRQTLGDDVLLRVRVERRVQQLIEARRLHAEDGRLLVDQLLLHHLNGDAHGRLR